MRTRRGSLKTLTRTCNYGRQHFSFCNCFWFAYCWSDYWNSGYSNKPKELFLERSDYEKDMEILYTYHWDRYYVQQLDKVFRKRPYGYSLGDDCILAVYLDNCYINNFAI